jgi:hypothetical protein
MPCAEQGPEIEHDSTVLVSVVRHILRRVQLEASVLEQPSRLGRQMMMIPVRLVHATEAQKQFLRVVCSAFAAQHSVGTYFFVMDRGHLIHDSSVRAQPGGRTPRSMFMVGLKDAGLVGMVGHFGTYWVQ